MALIKCNECGKEISDKATACPHCGAPSTQDGAAHAKTTDPNSCSKCGTHYIVEKRPVKFSPVLIISVPLFLIGIVTLVTNWLVAVIIIAIAFMIDHFGRSKQTVLVCPKCHYQPN